MKDNEEKMGKSDRKQGHRARQRRNEEQRGWGAEPGGAGRESQGWGWTTLRDLGPRVEGAEEPAHLGLSFRSAAPLKNQNQKQKHHAESTPSHGPRCRK